MQTRQMLVHVTKNCDGFTSASTRPHRLTCGKKLFCPVVPQRKGDDETLAHTNEYR